MWKSMERNEWCGVERSFQMVEAPKAKKQQLEMERVKGTCVKGRSWLSKECVAHDVQ